MEKKEMRKTMIGQLKQMERLQYEQHSRAIHDRLFADPLFQQAETIGITVSAFPEVDTLELIERAWREGKKVAVPKCKAKTRQMDFRLITDFEQLEVVYMELREPIESVTESVSSASIDFLLVPGVIFSEKGYRVGFGGGYYDRFLVNYQGITRSLAFDLQLRTDVPVEAHDLPVGGIYTETKFIDTLVTE